MTYNLFDPPNVNDPHVEEDDDEAPSVVNLDYEWPPRNTASDQLEQESALRPLEPNWRTGAVYYATLVVAESISSTTSTVVDLGVDQAGVVGNGTNATGSDTIAAYAVYDNGAPSKLMLFNYDYPRLDSDDNDTNRTFLIPSSLTSSQSVGVRYLLAANVTSHTKITWAGQRVGLNGQLEGEQETQTISCPQASSGADGCVLEVTVPGPGLALVWLDPDTQGDNIYSGNSTLVGFLQNGEENGAVRGTSMSWLSTSWWGAVVGLGVMAGVLL